MNQSMDGLWQIVLWLSLDGLLLWRLLGLRSGDKLLDFQLLRILHDLSRDPPDVAVKPVEVVQRAAAVEREVAHAIS